jgi:hypothetical protein
MDAEQVWDSPVRDGYQRAVVQPNADMCEMMCNSAVLSAVGLLAYHKSTYVAQGIVSRREDEKKSGLDGKRRATKDS